MLLLLLLRGVRGSREKCHWWLSLWLLLLWRVRRQRLARIERVYYSTLRIFAVTKVLNTVGTVRVCYYRLKCSFLVIVLGNLSSTLVSVLLFAAKSDLDISMGVDVLGLRVDHCPEGCGL